MLYYISNNKSSSHKRQNFNHYTWNLREVCIRKMLRKTLPLSITEGLYCKGLWSAWFTVLKWTVNCTEGNCGQFYHQTEHLHTQAFALKNLFYIYSTYHTILYSGVSALKNKIPDPIPVEQSETHTEIITVIPCVTEKQFLTWALQRRQALNQRMCKSYCWWECKLVQPLWRRVWWFIKKLKTKLPYDPEIPESTYAEIDKVQKDICTPMFIAELFTTAKTWKPPECPSTEQWIKKMWPISTMEYYPAVIKNEIMPFAAAWMHPEIVILSEVRKKKYFITSLTCGT